MISLYIKDKGDLILQFLFFEQLQFIKFVYDRNSPPIEIAAFHGTSLLLIILLSLKAESKLVLHSSNLQSYPLSHHCIPFAPLRIPPPQIYWAPIESYFLSSKKGERKIKEMSGKKDDSNMHNNQTAFADCLDHSIAR